MLGRFLVTKKQADIASFKTPDLRNVLVTAPYFHDGSQETLWDVVDHYNKGDGLTNPADEDIQPLALTEPEIDDLVAFLASLTNPQYRELGEKEIRRGSWPYPRLAGRSGTPPPAPSGQSRRAPASRRRSDRRRRK